MIHTPDSDVIFILLANLDFFPVCSVYIQTGGKNNRLIPVTDLHDAMGATMAHSLVEYHVFSGCDSVSAFTAKGKKNWASFY